MKNAPPVISIKAEAIFHLFGMPITNSLILGSLVTLFFFILAVQYNKQVNSEKKGGLYYAVSFLLKTIYKLFSSMLNENTEYFFPLLGAFFLYILFNNWVGLLPGVGTIFLKVSEGAHIVKAPILRGNNADLNTTLVLGLLSVVLTQYFGIKFVGFKSYISKFINIKNPINFAVGILELVSEVSKIISFSFRLFGNIFAGEVLLTIIAFLIPLFAPFPFLLLEVFVGLIQALVFAMLSGVFYKMAIAKHH